MSDVERKLAVSAARWQHAIGVMMLVFGLVVGVVIGIWISRSNDADERSFPLAAPHPPGPAPLTPEPEARYLDASSAAHGPYRFRFTEGEILYYGIDAEIEGQGWDLGQEGEIYLRFGSTFNLVTKSLDASGNAELRLVFESADVNGSFLDNPFEMSLDASGVQIVDGGRTATVGPGQPSPPKSPLEFLRTPVEMKVAPSGEVLNLSGPTGLSDLLAFLPAVARVEFPDEELYDGIRWETRFALPAPALGTAVETRVVNTFRGYQRVQDRYCAVVEQVLEGVQTGGTAEAFDSAGVDSMKFSVPLFNLTGKNTIYFDVNDRRLVHANLDMNLAMNIGGALGDAAGIVQLLGKSLLSPDREGLDDLQNGDGTEDLLDFNVSIVGAVSLLDSAALQSPQ